MPSMAEAECRLARRLLWERGRIGLSAVLEWQRANDSSDRYSMKIYWYCRPFSSWDQVVHIMMW